VSEQLEKLVDRCPTGRLLVRETLGELTIIALMLGFEADQVAQSDMTIAANTVGHDLTSDKKLEQVRVAHSDVTWKPPSTGTDSRTATSGWCRKWLPMVW
jgi:hypothetical protein